MTPKLDSRLCKMDFFTMGDVESSGLFAKITESGLRCEIEIGCGRGDLLAEYCALHPNTIFVGIERHLVSLRRAVEKKKRFGLNNLLLVHADIFQIMPYLKPHSVHAMHLYFPDPWPKLRHNKRRVLKDTTICEFTERLIPNGEFHIRSDNEEIYEDMSCVIKHSELLDEIAVSDDLLACRTSFEKRFLIDGKKIQRSSYRLR